VGIFFREIVREDGGRRSALVEISFFVTNSLSRVEKLFRIEMDLNRRPMARANGRCSAISAGNYPFFFN
jgi:hypothetical protein